MIFLGNTHEVSVIFLHGGSIMLWHREIESEHHMFFMWIRVRCRATITGTFELWKTIIKQKGRDFEELHFASLFTMTFWIQIKLPMCHTRDLLKSLYTYISIYLLSINLYLSYSMCALSHLFGDQLLEIGSFLSTCGIRT